MTEEELKAFCRSAPPPPSKPPNPGWEALQKFNERRAAAGQIGTTYKRQASLAGVEPTVGMS